jgi:hypothetical protein
MHALQTRKESVQTPALRALSTMLSGSDESTQAVLDAGILNVLPVAMTHSKARTRKEACWAASNVAAGTEAQVQGLFDSPLVPMIVERLDKDEFDVKKEAMWVVANAMHGAKAPLSEAAARRTLTLVTLGAIKPMVALLEVNDNAMVKLVLDAIGNMLGAGAELFKFGLGKADGIASHRIAQHSTAQHSIVVTHVSPGDALMLCYALLRPTAATRSSCRLTRCAVA